MDLDFTQGTPFLTRLQVRTTIRTIGPYGAESGSSYRTAGNKLLFASGRSGPMIDQINLYYDICVWLHTPNMIWEILLVNLKMKSFYPASFHAYSDFSCRYTLKWLYKQTTFRVAESRSISIIRVFIIWERNYIRWNVYSSGQFSL